MGAGFDVGVTLAMVNGCKPSAFVREKSVGGSAGWLGWLGLGAWSASS